MHCCFNPYILRLKTVTYENVFEMIIHQTELDNIHVLVLSGMTTYNAKLVEVDGYGAIEINDEAKNSFHIVTFTFVI